MIVIFNWTATEVKTWLSNHTYCFYMDVINFLFMNHYAGLVSIC